MPADRQPQDWARVMAVIELRQYTLVPRMRDTLIELFESDLQGGQEACAAK